MGDPSSRKVYDLFWGIKKRLTSIVVKLKTGIIGLGRIASLYEKDERAKKYYPFLTHAGAYSKHSAFEIVCGADIDAKRRRAFRRMWGTQRLYADYRDMLDENQLDILSICTHPELHYPIIESAAGRVGVIFCEKPFALNSQEIRSIIRLCRKTGTKITVNLYREYDRSHGVVRTLLKQRRYGELQRINCFYGKGLRNMGSHVLGYLIGTLGMPGKITVLGRRRDAGIEEDTYDVYLEFRGGIPAMLQTCDYDNYRLFEMDFVCESGRIQIVDEGLTFRFFESRRNRAESGARELVEARWGVRSTIGNALFYAVDHLTALSRKAGTAPVVSPEAYLGIQKVIEEIEQQGGKMPCLRS